MQISNQQALGVQLGLIYRALVVLLVKRADYSGTEDPFRNFRNVENIFDGISAAEGAIIRMMDKFTRVARHAQYGVQGEDIYDNDLVDLINYVGIVAALMLDNEATLNALMEDGAKLKELLNENQYQV